MKLVVALVGLAGCASLTSEGPQGVVSLSDLKDRVPQEERALRAWAESTVPSGTKLGVAIVSLTTAGFECRVSGSELIARRADQLSFLVSWRRVIHYDVTDDIVGGVSGVTSGGLGP